MYVKEVKALFFMIVFAFIHNTKISTGTFGAVSHKTPINPLSTDLPKIIWINKTESTTNPVLVRGKAYLLLLTGGVVIDSGDSIAPGDLNLSPKFQRRPSISV